MKRSRAYSEYLIRYKEMQRLLKIGKDSGDYSVSRRDIDFEVTLARATVVMLAGHLEGFLNTLLREIVNVLPNKWDAASLGQKRYVATCALKEISDFIQDCKPEDLGEEKRINDCRKVVQTIYEWFQIPQVIGATRDHGIKGFYKGCPPDVIEKTFKRFRIDNANFFKWIEQKKVDKSRVYTVLDQLVNQRSEIAHGELATKPTLQDARLYVVTATTLVRLIDEFMQDSLVVAAV